MLLNSVAPVHYLAVASLLIMMCMPTLVVETIGSYAEVFRTQSQQGCGAFGVAMSDYFAAGACCDVLAHISVNICAGH